MMSEQKCNYRMYYYFHTAAVEEIKECFIIRCFDFQIFWRDIKTRNPASYYRKLSPGEGIKLNTYDIHEWTAQNLDGSRLMIDGRPAIVQKENERTSRTIFRITNPGNNVEHCVKITSCAKDQPAA